ncbi:hypothetical protein D3C85_405230 [compost metagenome]
MKQIKNWLLAIIFASTVGGVAFTTMTPQTASAACTGGNILTIPPWYKGLQDDNDCKKLKGPADLGGLSNYIWKIVLNIIEIMLHLVGYICVAFIIYGGFIFMTAGGSDGAAKGRTTLLNAVIGVVISMASIAIVNLVTGFIQ